ncbi:response regulator, partial [Alcanivorax sp. HI0044]
GMQVTEAEHGKEACAAFQVADGAYDLVVLDMQMPVMDGYETAQALRDRGYGGPLLALTANVLAVDRQRCLDAGCDAFLGKPVRMRELLAVCAQLLNPSTVSVSR